jgi:hypothetical protein
MVGDAPGSTVTTETAGKSSEGNSSSLSVGITKAPMSKMAIVANAMRLRFLRLSLARNDITNELLYLFMESVARNGFGNLFIV